PPGWRKRLGEAPRPKGNRLSIQNLPPWHPPQQERVGSREEGLTLTRCSPPLHHHLSHLGPTQSPAEPEGGAVKPPEATWARREEAGTGERATQPHLFVFLGLPNTSMGAEDVLHAEGLPGPVPPLGAGRGLGRAALHAVAVGGNLAHGRGQRAAVDAGPAIRGVGVRLLVADVPALPLLQ
ncbi:hypothetical protein Celaphus_00017295, partial [Cervus elaphus hippelaphus]